MTDDIVVCYWKKIMYNDVAQWRELYNVDAQRKKSLASI